MVKFSLYFLAFLFCGQIQDSAAAFFPQITSEEPITVGTSIVVDQETRAVSASDKSKTEMIQRGKTFVVRKIENDFALINASEFDALLPLDSIRALNSDAVSHFKNADSETKLCYATALRFMGKNEKAIEIYESLYNKNSDSDFFAAEYAWALSIHNQSKLAIEILEKVLKKEPDCKLALYRMARILAPKNKVTAISTLDKLIASHPNFGEAYAYRGYIYASLIPKSKDGWEEYATKGRSDLARAIEINPTNARALHNKAWIEYLVLTKTKDKSREKYYELFLQFTNALKYDLTQQNSMVMASLTLKHLKIYDSSTAFAIYSIKQNFRYQPALDMLAELQRDWDFTDPTNRAAVLKQLKDKRDISMMINFNWSAVAKDAKLVKGLAMDQSARSLVSRVKWPSGLRTNSSGLTAIEHLIEKDANTSTLFWFIERARVDLGTSKTALHLATKKKRHLVQKLLLKNGSNQNEVNSDGVTPLQVAISNNDTIGTLLLLMHGGQVVGDEDGSLTVDALNGMVTESSSIQQSINQLKNKCKLELLERVAATYEKAQIPQTASERVIALLPERKKQHPNASLIRAATASIGNASSFEQARVLQQRMDRLIYDSTQQTDSAPSFSEIASARFTAAAELHVYTAMLIGLSKDDISEIRKRIQELKDSKKK